MRRTVRAGGETREAHGRPSSFPWIYITAAVATVSAIFPCGAGAQLPEYTLEPTVRIGSVDDRESALSTVSLMAVSSEGRVALYQPQSSSVWIFSPTGERLATVGGPGDGPGDFRAVAGLGWRADTLWVADGRLFRVTFFGPDQDPPRVIGGAALRREGVSEVPFPSDDDLWLLYRQWLVDPALRRYRQEIWSADMDWRPVQKLAETPEGWDDLRIVLPNAGAPMRGEQPFSEQSIVAIAPDASTVTTVERNLSRRSGRAVRYTVTRIALTGDTVFQREHPVELEPLTPELREAVIESYMSAALLQRAAPSISVLRDAVVEALHLPDFHPPWTKAVVGSDGSTWLRGPDDRSGLVRWLVHDASGEPTHTVVVDRAIGAWGDGNLGGPVVVMTADETGIWAVVQDELDIPYVVRYELRPR